MKGVDIYHTGRRYEYELMKILKKFGYYVIRAPASGRRTKHFFYPDILAIKRGRILLVEVKHFSEKRDVYIEREKASRYEWMESKTGGEAWICVHISNIGWRCKRMRELERVEGSSSAYVWRNGEIESSKKPEECF